MSSFGGMPPAAECHSLTSSVSFAPWTKVEGSVTVFPPEKFDGSKAISVKALALPPFATRFCQSSFVPFFVALPSSSNGTVEINPPAANKTPAASAAAALRRNNLSSRYHFALLQLLRLANQCFGRTAERASRFFEDTLQAAGTGDMVARDRQPVCSDVEWADVSVRTVDGIRDHHPSGAVYKPGD